MNATFRPWDLRTDLEILSFSSESGVELQTPESLEDLEATVRKSEASGVIDHDGRFVWAARLIAANEPERARAILKEAIERTDASQVPGRIMIMAAVADQELGRPPNEGLLTRLNARLAAGPERDVTPLWISAGRLLSNAGIFDEAEEAFDRAVGVARAQEDPAAMVWAMREAAQVAVLRRRFAQANGLLEQGRQFSPTDELTLLLRLDEARIDALCNRWASAIAHLEESLNLARTKLSPSHPFVDHTMISLAAARMELHGADATSRTLLDRALGIRLARNKAADSPEIAEALLLLGEHHRLNGNIDDALPLIGRAVAARQTNNEDRVLLAHALLVWSRALDDKGMTDVARQKREMAISMLPSP